LKFVELLSISAHLKRGRGNPYERSFDLVIENELDITYFIDYCLDSLLEAIKKWKKNQFLMDIGRLSSKFNLNSNQILLLQRLALNKFIGVTSQEHAISISRTREIARRELKDLFDKNY